jgi:hypothetical protein
MKKTLITLSFCLALIGASFGQKAVKTQELTRAKTEKPTVSFTLADYESQKALVDSLKPSADTPEGRKAYDSESGKLREMYAYLKKEGKMATRRNKASLKAN